jgi:hypothetical protein
MPNPVQASPCLPLSASPCLPLEAMELLVVDLRGDAAAGRLKELADLYTGGNMGRMARLLLVKELDPAAFHDELEAFGRARAA